MLRQLRSQFHEPSTYLKLRSWGSILDNRLYRPVTIWTLHEYPTRIKGNSAERIASVVFAYIAEQVMKHGDEATILKSDLSSIVSKIDRSKTSAISQIEKFLSQILSLFEDEAPVKIIGNKKLSSILLQIAEKLSSRINTKNQELANKSK
ncbi:hypothetical protein BGZ76_004706 [Entomortierella beljakovae]|nr:hypothetical protein BGZ76_004706 [Entomortierella beljakovae]